MEYYVQENKIVTSKELLDPKATLTCGQFFRFFGSDKEGYTVLSLDKVAKVYEAGDNVVIRPYNPCDVDYFINYFDLNADYLSFNKELYDITKDNFFADEKSLNFYLNAVYEGRGIRILNQDVFESFISFIISQNNNIPRIKGIIERLCVKYGVKINGTDQYSFPTATALSNASETDLKDCGLGYRVDFVKQAAARLSNTEEYGVLKDLPTKRLLEKLLGFYGVGNKVANCILLFAFHRFDSFPVDTWIEKIYREQTKDLKSNRDKINAYYENLFGKNAALMQQYIFYHIRNLNGITL